MIEGVLRRLSRVSEALKRRGVRRIGVQLPDGLKYECDEIARFLEGRGFEVIISGTGCYGACDVDLAMLEFVDVLLHVAHTPIFNVKRVVHIPYYVNYDVNVDDLRIEERSIALVASTQYAWKLPRVKRLLESLGYRVELGRGRGRVKMRGQVLGCNYSVLKDTKADAVLFIGDGLFHPLGVKMYTGKRVYRYSPLDREFEEVKIDDFVKKRLGMVFKAMDGERGAIIVSRKIGQNRIGLALRLKSEAERVGRRVDVIFLDDVIPERLSNFLYDYYVNTACPRISYDDYELFKVPVLTPQEFEMVIGLRDMNDYEMDEL